MRSEFKNELFSIIIVTAGWLAGIYFFINFPDRVITHWNFQGVADGYSGKAFGAFLLPTIQTIMYVMFLFLPQFDPKKENYKKFERTYRLLREVFLVFFFVLSIILGLVNLGYNLPINSLIPSAIGLLFIFLGSIMSKIEQNWFVGFRLPWTLSSEYVWKKTNRFGGWSFIFFGGLMLIIPLLPETAAMLMFIIGLLLVIFGTSIYSYLIFKQEKSLSKN